MHSFIKLMGHSSEAMNCCFHVIHVLMEVRGTISVCSLLWGGLRIRCANVFLGTEHTVLQVHPYIGIKGGRQAFGLAC